MKITSLIFFFLSLMTSIGLNIYLVLRPAEIIEVIKEFEQPPVGGMETVIPSLENNEVFSFPVHEDDFLMITSPSGQRISPFFGISMNHNGIDIAAIYKAQVLSMADGVIIEHWPPPGTPYPRGGVYKGHPVYGGMVKIQHEDGFQSLYAHMETTYVRQGQRVNNGGVIGRIGATGMAKGRHLHFEIQLNEISVNPLHYIPSYW